MPDRITQLLYRGAFGLTNLLSRRAELDTISPPALSPGLLGALTAALREGPVPQGGSGGTTGGRSVPQGAGRCHTAALAPSLSSPAAPPSPCAAAGCSSSPRPRLPPPLPGAGTAAPRHFPARPRALLLPSPIRRRSRGAPSPLLSSSPLLSPPPPRGCRAVSAQAAPRPRAEPQRPPTAANGRQRPPTAAAGRQQVGSPNSRT